MIVPTTLAALAVAVFAVVPGAACMLAYSARAGAYGVSLPDRVVRFLAVSIAFQAVLSGLTYNAYKSVIKTGALERGEVSAWALELSAVCYVAVPFLVGWLVGEGIRRNWLSLGSLFHGSPEPRAWDYVFAHRQVHGILRMRLKSGRYIAGVFAISENEKTSHASGYPEAGDLYLSQTVVVDPTSGSFQRGENGKPRVLDSGILIRWEEIEFIEFFE